MAAERVVHVKRPRPGVPFIYAGRTMFRQQLKNTGWGNPYRGDDAVADFEMYLLRTPVLLSRLPEFDGYDAACWCCEWEENPRMEICHCFVILRMLDALREWCAGEGLPLPPAGQPLPGAAVTYLRTKARYLAEDADYGE
ncbi:MAG: DUF4326 domain-containing protein [Chloroflexi bacterium]|nr:DUF4326 domain-containing protein [Chloroflexota bacterium]